MKTMSLAAILLLAVAKVEATTILLDDSSTPLQHVDWIGTYGTPGGFFSARIGTCPNPADCTYNSPQDFRDPAGTSGIHGTITTINHSELNYIPQTRQWTTINEFDLGTPNDPFLGKFRSGVYCVVGVDGGCVFRDVPEPSAAWLLLAGASALIWMKFSNS